MNKKVWLALGISAVVAGCAGLDPDSISQGDNKATYQGDRAELVAEGKRLWNDPSIGNSGLSCQACHMNGAQFKKTFLDDYPHKVRMAKGMAGLPEVTTEQMVQLCMVVPMKGEPLPWDSKELAALTAYTEDVAQPEYRAKKAK